MKNQKNKNDKTKELVITIMIMMIFVAVAGFIKSFHQQKMREQYAANNNCSWSNISEYYGEDKFICK